MRFFKLFIPLVTLILISACSSNGAVIPDKTSVPLSEQIVQDWGTYGLSFDPDSQEIDILYDRESSVHYDITAFLNPPACGGLGCITASLINWNPATLVATFNVTITNPSAWTPSDVRMIFYNLGGREIVNVDSYTKAFVGTIEPFIAFGKANPNRTFPAGAAITETVKIYWPPMSPFVVWFKVSAWLWLNCQDPYEINNQFQAGTLTPNGGSATIGCQVLDWQNNVTGVTIDTTPITGGVTALANIAAVWQATITNSMGAGVGTYKSLITASSPNPQNFDLYHYLDIVISPPGWGSGDDFDLQPGPCTLDFGVIANNPAGHTLVTFPDPAGVCNQIWKYPGWGNPPVFYASLANLDPSNPMFKPWPVVRLDAANDGAFGWTNRDSTTWQPNPPLAGINNYCNFDNIPSFTWFPVGNDNRHEMVWMNELPLWPVDCCDTFNDHQCALYVDLGHGIIGFQGINGFPQGGNYLDNHIRWEAYFPAFFIGDEYGQVDPADVSGIDCMITEEEDVIRVFIAERVHGVVEVYDINDVGPGPNDIVTYYMTIPILNNDQFQCEPIDIELLPGRDQYEPLPGIPILCVLIDNAAFPFPPPGFGGTITIYDAETGALVDQIGDSANPGVMNQPAYLDTDDRAFAIHVMQQGPTVTVFKYS
ncbi:MAG: hypothetical protein ABIG42_10040 [bacterium]